MSTAFAEAQSSVVFSRFQTTTDLPLSKLGEKTVHQHDLVFAQQVAARILAPGDPNEVSNCMDYIINNPGPSYLRLGKTGEPNFSNRAQTINDGQWNLVKEGKDNKRVIVSTGTALDNAIALRQKKHQGCAIYTVPVWSMKSKKKTISKF